MSEDNSNNKSSGSNSNSNIVKDIYLWRRKWLSGSVVVIATAAWVVMQVYQFNFVTVASWLAVAVVTSLFIWGNLRRLFRKEEAQMSGLEISEKGMVQMAHSIRECLEELIRWMFRVGAEKEWYITAGIVARLWLLSVIGSCVDLLTLVYIGILIGMTMPVICTKCDYKIREYRERLEVQCKRLYRMINEKVVQKVKERTVVVKKEKKIE